MKRLLLVGLAYVALASPAVPAPAVAPVATWTGCYIGGNVGYGWAPTSWSDAGVEFDSHTADGVVGGGQVGCDYQTGQWLFGIQGMFDGTGMKGDSHRVVGALGPNVFDQTQVSWFATLTGRIGYTVQPLTLLYVKGGVAWVRDKHDECCLPPTPAVTVDDGFANVTRTGWTVGIGLEHMFQPNWSAFLEYDFIGLGTDAITFTPTGPTTSAFVYNIQQNVHTILVGINYRFGGLVGRQY
jgi:outer membrane immunogenic protein